jgi:hypothetical protein
MSLPEQISGSKREEQTGGKLHCEDLHNSPNTVSVIKSKRVKHCVKL